MSKKVYVNTKQQCKQIDRFYVGLTQATFVVGFR